MKLLFALSGKKTTKSLNIAIHHQGKRFKRSLGIQIKEKDWNSKKQNVKSHTDYYYELNIFLSELETDIMSMFLSDKEKYELNWQSFEDDVSFRVSNRTSTTKTLLQYYSEFIATKEITATKNTIKNYKTNYNHILEFQKYKVRTLLINDINPEFKEQMLSYLINTKRMNNNTINDLLKKLKVFMNWCYELDIINHNKFKFLKYKTYIPTTVALSRQELEHLYNLNINSPSLKRVRDVFCFACFTGQRYSDIKTLMRQDILKSIWTNHVKKN